MYSIPKKESDSQSPISYNSKEDCNKIEEISIDDQSIELNKMESPIPEINFTNTFVDVSETPKDVENAVINETSLLIPIDDPLSTENDNCSKEYSENVTINKIKMYHNSLKVGSNRAPAFICSRNCCSRISKKEQKHIFDTFWDNRSFESRLSFISRSSEVTYNPILHRTFVKYYFNTTEGRHYVCSHCFRGILQITRSYLTILRNERAHKYHEENIQTGDLTAHSSDTDDENADSFDEMSENQTSQRNIFSTDISQNVGLNKKLKSTSTDVTLREKRLLEGWSPLPPCRRYCNIKIKEEEQKKIFQSYWKNATSYSRQKFICDMTESVFRSKRLLHTFYLNTKTGSKKVCNNCFCSVIGECRRFTQYVLNDNWHSMNPTIKLKSAQPKSISLSSNKIDANQETSALESNIKQNQKQENCNVPLIDLEASDAETTDLDDEVPKKLPGVEVEKFHSHVFLCSKLLKKRFEIEAMKDLKNEEANNITTDGDVLEQEEKITSPFVKLEEIDNEEKNILPAINSIIKEEVDIDNDSDDHVGEDKKQSNDISSSKTDNIKIKGNPETSNGDIDAIETVCKKSQELWRPLPDSSNNCHVSKSKKDQEHNLNKNWNEEKAIYDSRTALVNQKYKILEDSEKDEEVTKKEVGMESNIETYLLVLNRNSDSPEIIEECINSKSEMKIPSENIVPNYIGDNVQDKNHQGELSHPEKKIPSKNLKVIQQKCISKAGNLKSVSRKKTFLSEENSLSSSERVKKNRKDKIKDQICNVFTDNSPQTDSIQIRPFESEISSSANKQSEGKFSDKVELLIKKYAKNVKLNPERKKNNFATKILDQNILPIDVTNIFSSKKQILNPSDEDFKKVKEHIKKFPLCESYHYNRQSNEKYLPMGLTTKVMYDLYRNEVSNPVSIVWYQKILGQTDLKFKLSFLTKCDKCNASTLQYKLSNDPSEKSKINSQRTAHLVDSEEANNSKSQDEQTKNLTNSLMVCSFGFQQSLPTPFLHIPVAYYKQRLWTYNFTVQHQLKSTVKNHRKFYMWHEAEGKRSANEIASCLYEYLWSLSPKIKTIIFYSSSCNGESRSKTLLTMFLYLMANHKSLETVEHKFLVSGHSQIEENLGNTLVEDIMKFHEGKIEQPKDWYDAFDKHIQKTNESELVVMTPENFYDFESMSEDVFKEIEPFIKNEVKWLRYTKDGVFYKNNWSTTDRFQVLKFKELFELKSFSKMKLRNLESGYITEEKKKDLLDLMPFIKSEGKSFYETIPTKKNLLQKDVCLEQDARDDCEISLLKRKFEEIDEYRNKDLPQGICIIKKECFEVANSNVNVRKEEPLKKTPKKDCDEINSCKFELVTVKEECF